MTRLAILVEEGFQDEEVLGPKCIAEFLGWDVKLVGPANSICNVHERPKGKHGIVAKVDVEFGSQAMEVSCSYDPSRNWDAVLIPGGWQCPERLRQNQTVLRFISDMHAASKVVAAICHGPLVLCSCIRKKAVATNIMRAPSEKDPLRCRARRMTCYPGCKDDIINAGAEWVDQPVVTDGNVITAQHYRDVPQFVRSIAELLK